MNRKWWHDKVVYQIYPKSFMDSNGDGIGDLGGILQKLDYLKGLGVDMIWISPIYRSPMIDNGYDISDYYEIDPQFGTMEEMDALIAQAKERDIKIIMDLVVNHCSSEHIWFQKALKDPTGEYGNYFIIRKGNKGKRPNNWRSVFDGSVWEPIEGTDLYYYHTFAKEQPDLNWENPKLRSEIYKMMNYWLEKGLGGFRIDAITYIKKDAAFRDLQPDGTDGLAGVGPVAENYPGIEAFLMEMRKETFDQYGAFSVAEMAGVKSDKLQEYIGEDGLFSSIFDFSYLDLDVACGQWFRKREVTAKEMKEKMFESQKMAQEISSFLSVVLENHDQPRSLSKWIPKEQIGFESASMLATYNLTLRGIPFIYQGEEIGMTNCEWNSIGCFDDVMTHGQYQRALLEGYHKEEAIAMANRRSRDHARLPMQWENTKNAGFTEGEPWILTNTNYHEVNVADQLGKEASLWNYYRKLILLRKSKEYKDVFTYGNLLPYRIEPDDVIAYTRQWGKIKISVFLNFSKENQQVKISDSKKTRLISNYQDFCLEKEAVQLRPYEAIVFCEII